MGRTTISLLVVTIIALLFATAAHASTAEMDSLLYDPFTKADVTEDPAGSDGGSAYTELPRSYTDKNVGNSAYTRSAQYTKKRAPEEEETATSASKANHRTHNKEVGNSVYTRSAQYTKKQAPEEEETAAPTKTKSSNDRTQVKRGNSKYTRSAQYTKKQAPEEEETAAPTKTKSSNHRTQVKRGNSKYTRSAQYTKKQAPQEESKSKSSRHSHSHSRKSHSKTVAECRREAPCELRYLQAAGAICGFDLRSISGTMDRAKRQFVCATCSWALSSLCAGNCTAFEAIQESFSNCDADDAPQGKRRASATKVEYSDSRLV